MIFFPLAPLRESLRPHFNLSKSRLETLSVLLVGMINGRAVNLSHIAQASFQARRAMHRTTGACSVFSSSFVLMATRSRF